MPNFSVDRFESLRRAGKTYSEMEKILGVSRNTLKSYAHTHGVPKKGESKPVCALCGCNMNPRGKQRFCSDTCRYAWNYSHRIMNAQNAVRKTCAHCGQPFYSYPSSHKVYCCRDCYLAGRYGRRA